MLEETCKSVDEAKDRVLDSSLGVQVMRYLVLVLCVLFAASSEAKGNIGVGFVLGSPTALSAKGFISKKNAWDVQLAFDDDAFIVYGDYLMHFPGAFKTNDPFGSRLTPYVGVGPVLAVETKDRHDEGKFFDERDDDMAIGVRVPFGVEWIGDEVPIGVGLEIGPGIIVAPGTDGFFTAGVTLRYYF